jgi:DnaK suppressor protein
MSKNELEVYRRQLMAMAHSVRGNVETVSDEAFRRTGAGASGNLSNMPVHLGDLSSDTYEHEVAIGLLENEDKMLAQILLALNRLDNGTYGRCVQCGRDIPTERLQILPYTPHCVECAGRVQHQSVDKGTGTDQPE